MDPFTLQPAQLDSNKICNILDIHGAVNDCICMLFILQCTVFERDSAGGKLSDDLSAMGAALTRCTKQVADTTALVKANREALTSVKLRVSMHTFDQWLTAVGAFLRLVQEHAVSEVCGLLDRATKEVDKLCPKWSSCVSDTVLNLEMAEVMLVQSPTVPHLRPALDALWQTIFAVGQFGNEAGLPPVDQYMATKEWVALAHNSLTFGKQTIKVAAALRCLTGKRHDQLAVILKHSDSFPKALLDKLKAMEEDDGDERGDSSAKAPPKPPVAAAAGLKRKASTNFDKMSTHSG